MVARAGIGAVRQGRPLPLRPAGSVSVGPAASLLEDDQGGAVFIWGMASSCWDGGDIVSRRRAAVHLVATGAATRVEVARAFGVETETLRLWSRDWEAGGAGALAPGQRGSKGPSKLTPALAEKVRSLRSGGATLAAIAAKVRISTDTVRFALAGAAAADKGD